MILIVELNYPILSLAGIGVNPETGRLDLCLTVEEEDGSPSATGCQTIEVTSGTLTDDGDGAFSLSTGGGGGNSFETIAVPAGASVVADSSTDTLTLTETSFLTITGTAATDTIDITQVTTDLGTDGLIAANAVALGTDTTNAYVSDLTAGTYIDVSGGGAETANVTVTVDTTEIGATTFGSGVAGFVWTFDVGATDPTLTFTGVGGDIEASSTFSVDGIADEITFRVQGFSTQTTSLAVLEQSDGTDVFTFSNAGDAVFGGDLDLEDDTPHIRLTDTTASQDDFEWYADTNEVYLQNVTDATTLFRFDSSNNLILRGGARLYSWPTADGTNGQFLTTNGSGTMTWTTAGGSPKYLYFSQTTVSVANTFYMAPGGGDAGGTEGNHDNFLAPETCTASSLYAIVNTAPGAGNSWTVCVNVNGTALTEPCCAISGTDTSCSETVSTGTVTGAQSLNVEFLESGTATGSAGSGFGFICTP